MHQYFAPHVHVTRMEEGRDTRIALVGKSEER
jgi:hypothetical protein